MKHWLIGVLCLFLIVSCEKDGKKVTVEKSESKTLSFNADSTSIHWVAYKLTSKIGVKGVFDTFKISDVKDGGTPQKMFVGAEFSITMRSLNTGVPARDNKIKKHFFGKLDNSEMLKGKLISLDASGKGKMSYMMNNKTSEIDVTSTLEGNTFTLSGTLDLDKHNAQGAIKSLNDACGKNHIGEDGISKMWPDVDFKIVTKL